MATAGLVLALIGLIAAGCGRDAPGADGDVGASAIGFDFDADATVLAVVGDAGEFDEATLEVASLVEAAQPAAVFTVGDNEYTTEGRTVESFERSVGDVYGRWVDEGKFFPIPGDHDYGDACTDTDEPADLDAYLEYFDLPTGPEDETYYDVVIDDIHVFALDSLLECHRDNGAKLERERAWLEAAATASTSRLNIVLLHNPPYSSGTAHGSVESLRWDFAGWGIDLVIAGDDHIYERSTHDGVVYLVNGLGGVAIHEIGDPIEGSEIRYADEYGAVFIATNPGSSTADVSFRTISGEIIDTLSIALGPADGSAASNSGSPPGSETETADRPDGTNSGLARPDATAGLVPGMTWQWQLQGDIDTSHDVDLYDIDLFDTDTGVIERLHADRRYVVCYFSAGSFEDWRDDADAFPEDALGESLDGWEGERWLDIRRLDVRSILETRLDLAADKGCDGVEPDNVTGAYNDTGFDLTPADQLDFNRFLADAAHRRGLTIALKNDLEQIDELVDHFDFAVNEECHEFDECDVYQSFLASGKPVLNAEYAPEFVDDPDAVCARAKALGLSTVIFDLELDNSLRIPCQ